MAVQVGRGSFAQRGDDATAVGPTTLPCLGNGRISDGSCSGFNGATAAHRRLAHSKVSRGRRVNVPAAARDRSEGACPRAGRPPWGGRCVERGALSAPKVAHSGRGAGPGAESRERAPARAWRAATRTPDPRQRRLAARFGVAATKSRRVRRAAQGWAALGPSAIVAAAYCRRRVARSPRSGRPASAKRGWRARGESLRSRPTGRRGQREGSALPLDWRSQSRGCDPPAERRARQRCGSAMRSMASRAAVGSAVGSAVRIGERLQRMYPCINGHTGTRH